jgi:peptide/nickel transport system permease protein
LARYIVQRLLQSLLVLLGLITIVFFSVRLTGDPATMMVAGNASEEVLDDIRRDLGLDKPVYIQYFTYLWDVVHGDFGESFIWGGRSCTEVVLARLPATAELTAAGLFIIVFLAVPIGLLAAAWKNTFFDTLTRIAASIGQAMPAYWLGLMLIIVFAVNLGVVPTSGRTEGLRSLILPSITISIWSVGRVIRLTRSRVIEVMRSKFIQTAVAKGLKQRYIYIVHVLKNAMIAIVTLIGLEIRAMFGGAIITEAVFAWPGIGSLIIMAVRQRDFPVIQASILLMGIIVSLLNLITDIVYGFLDPRIRLD